MADQKDESAALKEQLAALQNENATLKRDIAALKDSVGRSSKLTPAQEKDARARAATGALTYEQAVEVVLAQAAHDAAQKKTAKA